MAAVTFPRGRRGREEEMNREEATEQILEAKRENGLTYEVIARKVGAHKVWTTAACWASTR